MTVQLYHGDCLDVMASMAPNSIDAIVTDPPYGLAFMGKDWDHGVPGAHFWQEALRVAKPGAHLLAFGGTRTFHRLAVAIEDAGWELRDTVCWLYGSGFPKSHDVSKAIDREAGAEREVVGHNGNGRPNRAGKHSNALAQAQTVGGIVTQPATPAAQQWDGWGTALKPAWEPIIVARKPLQGTVAANVLAWGTGAINVDGCRIGDNAGWSYPNGRGGEGWHGRETLSRNLTEPMQATQGRWPANVVHDGSDEVLAGFPVTTSGAMNSTAKGGQFNTLGKQYPRHVENNASTGSAARFFYCAKASKADRDEGLEGLEVTERQGESTWAGECPECGCRMMMNGKPTCGHNVVSWVQGLPRRNHHPTVKPTALMRWLVRLVTRPGGVVLDPFMGSGSTGKAAVIEGMAFVGIEQDAEYLEIARRRIDAAQLPLLETI